MPTCSALLGGTYVAACRQHYMFARSVVDACKLALTSLSFCATMIHYINGRKL